VSGDDGAVTITVEIRILPPLPGQRSQRVEVEALASSLDVELTRNSLRAWDDEEGETAGSAYIATVADAMGHVLEDFARRARREGR
jgi:hypothetical protein